jgi:heat shock protein HtpX
MVLTMFLLGLVYVVFAGVLWWVGIPWPFLVIGAALIAGFQLFFSDKIALASMKAQFVDEQEAPQLHDMIGRLAAQANLPKPRSPSSIPRFQTPSPLGATPTTPSSPSRPASSRAVGCRSRRSRRWSRTS